MCQPPGNRSVHITRSVTPWCESGSIPDLAEAGDEIYMSPDFGAKGQRTKAPVADFIGSEQTLMPDN